MDIAMSGVLKTEKYRKTVYKKKKVSLALYNCTLSQIFKRLNNKQEI